MKFLLSKNASRFLLTLAIFGSLLASSEQSVDQSREFALATMEELKSKVKEYTLANGLSVVMLQDTRKDKVFLATGWNIGSAFETQKTKGYTALLAKMFYRGTAKMSEVDIRNIASNRGYQFGIDYNSIAFQEGLINYFNVKSEDSDLFLSILADCAQNLRLGEDQISSELEVSVRQVDQMRDDPWACAFDSLNKTLFSDGHPYANPTLGIIESLAAVDSKKLMKFYKNNCKMNNCKLFLFGNFDQEAAIKAIKRLFGGYPSGSTTKAKKPFKKPVLKNKSTKITISHEIGTPLAFGAWRVPGLSDVQKTSAGVCAMQLLFGQTECGLKKLLVDQLKLANSIIAAPLISCKDVGVNFVNISCPIENIDKCLEQLSLHIEKFQDVSFFEKDLETLKKDSCLGFSRFADGNYAFLGIVLAVVGVVAGLSLKESFDTSLMDNVSASDVQSFIKTYLQPGLMVQVVVVPFDQEARAKRIEENSSTRAYVEELLKNHQRTSELEAPRLALELEEACKKIDSQATSVEGDSIVIVPTQDFVLDNGLRVITHKREGSGDVHCTLFSRCYNTMARTLTGSSLCLMAWVGSFWDEVAVCSLNRLCSNGSIFSNSGFGTFKFGFKKEFFEQDFNKFLDFIVGTKIDEKLLEASKARVASLWQTYQYGLSCIEKRARENLLFSGTDSDFSYDQYIRAIKEIGFQEFQVVRKKLFSPSELVLSIAGDIPGDLRPLIEAICGAMQNCNDALGFEIKQNTKASSVAGQTLNTPGTSSQKLVSLFRVSPMERFDNRIFAVNLLSRILINPLGVSEFSKIRDTAGLFSYADCAFCKEVLSATQWLDQISAVVDANQAKLFINSVYKIFDDVQTNGIDKDVFERLKRVYVDEVENYLKNNAYLSNYFAELAVENANFDFYAKNLSFLKSLTHQEFCVFAREMCKIDDWAVIEVGGTQ